MKPIDGAWPPMSADQIVRFLAWLDFQATHHYAQRKAVRERRGASELAYCLKIEAHTYERVRTAFIQVLSGDLPARVPSR